jgi:hypothetical protein
MTAPFVTSKFLACVVRYAAAFSHYLNVSSEKQFADYSKYNIEILDIRGTVSVLLCFIPENP